VEEESPVFPDMELAENIIFSAKSCEFITNKIKEMYKPFVKFFLFIFFLC
jgi:hypothetical protein